MKLSMVDDRGVCVVCVDGDVEGNQSAVLTQFLGAMLLSGRRRFVLDLSLVGFIDSSGLAAVVTFLKRVRGEHGDLLLAGLQPEVRRVMDLTRLDRVFEALPTVQEAHHEMVQRAR